MPKPGALGTGCGVGPVARGALAAARAAAGPRPPPAATRPPPEHHPEHHPALREDSVFTRELGLTQAEYGKAGGVRTRQHVNPLRLELQRPLPPPPDWGAVFPAPARPLTVDCGCGSGRFLLLLAKRAADGGGGGGAAGNFLGMEIREKLVGRANTWRDNLGLPHAQFLTANATVSFRSLLETYPGPLELVCIQFPDPHFKVRHRKRRIVQPELVRAVADLLAPGGRVFLQSDVEEVAADMRDHFEEAAGARFELAAEHARAGATFLGEHSRNRGGLTWASAGWLRENPLGAPTERELYAEADGDRAHRVLLVKKRAAA